MIRSTPAFETNDQAFILTAQLRVKESKDVWVVIDDVYFLTLSKSISKWTGGGGWYDSSRYLLRLQDGPVTVFLNKKISLIPKIDFNVRACDNNQ